MLVVLALLVLFVPSECVVAEELAEEVAEEAVPDALELERSVPVRLALDLAVGSAIGVALVVVRLPVGLAVADWAVADWAVLLPEADWVGDEPVGDASVVGQLDEADPDGDELALLEAAADDWLGAEALGLAEAVLVTLVGPVAGFGGRLETGGRTTVTSPTTGSGLSGSAEAPSR